MKRLVVISAISIVLLTMIASPSAQTPRRTMGHSEWVARSLDAIQSIKVGTTRRELLKLFTVEGVNPVGPREHTSFANAPTSK